jgi:type II secretory pathway component GspD/PulD (secretin)
MKARSCPFARIRGFGLASLLLLAMEPLGAQIQPETAVNHQDEQINLNKSVEADTSQFTIFRSGDKAEINNYISEVVELKYAVAYELLPHVLKAVRREKGDARTLKYKDPETGGTRYFIQVVTTRDQMPSVVETIQTLDLPGVTSSAGDTHYHQRMKYRRASEVANVIASTVLSGEGAVFADDVTNTLYIEDSQSDGERDVITAEFYDVPPPQVEFEVLAVEIEEDDAGDLGLDWTAWKRALGGQFQVAGSRIEGGEGFARLDALLTVDAQALASFLNYTVQTGTANVVTNTKLTASNDRPGILSSLRRVSSFEYETVFRDPDEFFGPRLLARQEVDDRTQAPTWIVAPPSQSYLRNRVDSLAPGASGLDPSLQDGPKAEGIYLVIQPTVGTELVTAGIRVVVNSLSGYTRLDEPILSERTLDTLVTLKNDEPFALGGLDKETTANVRRGVPGLKEIPGLKSLFSVEKETRKRSKVFLVITPHFRNQVNFDSLVLESRDFAVEPPVTVNANLPVPDVQALLEMKPPAESGKMDGMDRMD